MSFSRLLLLLSGGIRTEQGYRVEITGPTDRKMVVNALNSGAKTFMADFEGESAVDTWALLLY